MKVTFAYNLDRFTEIEKANRLLLERITNIMSSRRESIISTASSFTLSRPRSLNRLNRKKEFNRIVDENCALLKRLKERKSNYDFGQKREQTRNAKMITMNEHSYGGSIKSLKKLPNLNKTKKYDLSQVESRCIYLNY